jgi:hypothetical protein
MSNQRMARLNITANYNLLKQGQTKLIVPIVVLVEHHAEIHELQLQSAHHRSFQLESLSVAGF